MPSFKPSSNGDDCNLLADTQECKRLDLQHDLFRATFGGRIFFSPVKNVHSVLDIGCGTSIWGIEVANDYFSEATVVGMDLGYIKPYKAPPSNYKYVVANFEHDWPFQQPFDFIHGRMILFAMQNHLKVIQQAWQHLHPRGWFELQDLELGPDGIIEENPPSLAFRSSDGIMEWNKYFAQGSAKLGVDVAAAKKWPTWLREAGFVNISHQMFRWPIGPWSDDPHLKSIGESTMDNWLSGIESFSTIVFTKGLGWSKEELRLWLEKIRKEIIESNRHYYMKIHVFYAQKPNND